MVLLDYIMGLHYGVPVRHYITKLHYEIELRHYIRDLYYRIILRTSILDFDYRTILRNYIIEFSPEKEPGDPQHVAGVSWDLGYYYGIISRDYITG